MTETDEVRAEEPVAAPRRGRGGALIAVAICLVAVAVGAGIYWKLRPHKPAVLIEAYYPLNPDHQFIADYLREFEKKYPGKVKVVIYDMQSPEGRKKWATTGLGCAGVFINGSTRHEVVRSDGTRETVDFLKRMDSFWSREDFEAVVKQLLEKEKASR